jgi:hypothetical protein
MADRVTRASATTSSPGVKWHGTEHAEGAAAVQSEEPVTAADEHVDGVDWIVSWPRAKADAPHADVGDREEIPGKRRRFCGGSIGYMNDPFGRGEETT